MSPGSLDRSLGALMALKSDATDDAFACAIADVLLAHQPFPLFRLSIDHNVKGAKAEKPPVFYNWQLRDTCGLETNIRNNAYAWIIEALKYGYTVTRHLKAHTESSSIKIERDRAAYRERPRVVHSSSSMDDDIPF